MISIPKTQQSWEIIEQTMETTTDKLGRGIDPKILPVVVALNMVGFPTTQSCEGHLDHGLPYAWVHITPEGAEDAYNLALRAKEEGDMNAVVAHCQQMRRLLSQTQRRLKYLLTIFYRDRVVDIDQQLVLEPMTFTIILRNRSEQGVNLTACQDEMSAFAQFLQERQFKRAPLRGKHRVESTPTSYQIS